MMTATLDPCMSLSDLVRLDTSISNAMSRAARVDNVEAMKSLLRDRRRVRAEIDARRAAATN